jgi:hypothetical protein
MRRFFCWLLRRAETPELQLQSTTRLPATLIEESPVMHCTFHINGQFNCNSSVQHVFSVPTGSTVMDYRLCDLHFVEYCKKFHPRVIQ